LYNIYVYYYYYYYYYYAITVVHMQDRYWRKNRHPNVGYECAGVDLNRNFDVEWGSTLLIICFTYISFTPGLQWFSSS